MLTRKLTALTIGNSSYPGATLSNPVNDADDITTALTALGFSVVKLTDARLEEVDRAISSFRDNLNSNDVGLFYFAGHGMQIAGENYITAVDTKFADETSAKYSSYPLNQLIDVMAGCSNSTNLIILDACRNNPYVRAWNRDASVNGLAPVFTPKGTLIAFATSPGETAADGAGRNGSYTESLLRHINTPDVPIEDVFKRTRNTLSVITSGKQTSWEHTSLIGDFVFNVSIGRQITIYSSDALADGKYLLANTNPLRGVITGLKSHDWYTQNSNIYALNVALLGSANNDALFVLGRNIYQAAVGSSRTAIAYLHDFRNKINGLAPDKVKAFLDGMLFEIFFNSKGELRRDFKISLFNTVFDLSAFPEFAPSFDFISEVLINYQNRFYVVPGKQRTVTVDISTVPNENGESVITGIFFEGFNILRQSDDPMAVFFKDKPSFYPTSLDRLKEQISMEMVIPLSRLTLNTTTPIPSNGMLLPSYHTVSK
jgi:uncharacterized caspase-like protein